jgi:phage shock protein PspC (stress-responsive transcriptional regulator)
MNRTSPDGDYQRDRHHKVPVAIIASVCGGIALLIIIAFIIYCCCIKKKKKDVGTPPS